ncbi:MAG: rhomboid family intramembrane serine protease [Rhizobiaceae bacterium]|nr:rhomboid family intramembrane serine protease [Rhizobiaceae bacterium]
MTIPDPVYPDSPQPPREPVFNVPLVILATLLVLAAIHGLREYILSREAGLELLIRFAFIPSRYMDEALAAFSPLALYWSPLSYSLLHSDWTHLLVNGFWLLAFGGVVANRIGTLRFVGLFIAGAVGGAMLHYLAYPADNVPMIGASASVSAFVGAAVRFAFPSGRSFVRDASQLPRQSLVQAFSNRQVLIFVGIWFAINLFVGTGAIDIDGSGNTVAWQAHIGGFLIGLLCFSLFDRRQ